MLDARHLAKVNVADVSIKSRVSGILIMGTLGERLQQARLRAGLSLRDISTRTKIREPLLAAIEREDFTRLPPGLLGRGFLRAYAREVGLSPEEVVRQFQDEFEAKPTAPEPPPPIAAGDFEQPQHSDSNRRWQGRFFVVAVVAALTTVAFIYLSYRPQLAGDARPDPIATIGSREGSPTDAGQESQDAVQAGPVEAAIAPANTSEAEPLTVTIDPTGPVWVQATADGVRVVYQLLQAGERRSIDVRDELLVRVGDAGAFQYSINGERGRRVGGPGAVRDIRITRDNYTTFHDR